MSFYKINAPTGGRIVVLIFCTLLLIGCQPSEIFYKNSLCIENITTIDAKNGAIENQTVIIKDGKIYKIAPSAELKLAKNNKIIDGSGKYLIPGLWDAHVHFAYIEEMAPSMFDLFIGYGITSVRDTGGKINFVKYWKDRARANPTTAPRVMIAGPLLDGVPNVYDGSDLGHPELSVGLSTTAEVESKIEELVGLHVDFLKAYEMLSPEQFKKVTQRASEKGLKVTGHIPLSMDVIEASNAGLNSMEHLRNLEFSCASNAAELFAQRTEYLASGKNDPGGELRSRIHRQQRLLAIENYDDKKADEVLAVLAANDTWQIPTLALYRSVRMLKNFQYLPDSIRKHWENDFMSRNPTSEDINPYTQWMSMMVGKIHKKKISIMAGTDTPIGYLTPGLSLHEELHQLVESGLSPLEALKTATLNPAIYFNLENELGWIGENTWADLVILDANPLDKIDNTRRINGVVKQGEYYDRKRLDHLLTNVGKNKIELHEAE